MVSAIDNILGVAQRRQLIAIQRTQRGVDETQLRLATGLKVNSALDNPQNFFAARSLDNRSNDLQRLLDGIGQNIQVIKTADSAIKGVQNLLDTADALTADLELELTRLRESSKPLTDVITEDFPVAYYRLNEEAGNVAENLGSGGAAINGSYNANVTKGSEDELFLGQGGDSVGATFNATNVNERISIPDSPLINTGVHTQRTVELVFNAAHTNGRQVLYEEGGTVNALNIYIEDGYVYVNGRDAGAWGPVTIRTEIEANRTYHVSFVMDTDEGFFGGYLDGELFGTAVPNAPFPSHSANIGIGAMNGDSYYHDGPVNGNNFAFQGVIAEVAIYNDALTADDMKERFAATLLAESRAAEEKLEAIFDQLDELVLDAGYRGTNLLDGDTMTTFFNERRTSFLETEGDFFSAAGLGISESNFTTLEGISTKYAELRSALERVRSFGSSLANDLAIIQTREDFTLNMINTLVEGSDKLTVADQNEEGAKMLAAQVRQQVQVSVLAQPGLSIADFLI
ncbi:MAG: LamG-like jellyroll fold domain-containing protein [Pseudomonadota bacterium]|nr:LamG-like jellyroll fold domain-containing protein [Pseudomonadota bacterium]